MNNFVPHPIARIDYPETLQEFDAWFALNYYLDEYTFRFNPREHQRLEDYCFTGF